MSETDVDVADAPPPAPPVRRQVTFVPGNVWRVGLVAIALLALALFLRFVIDDGGSVIFTVLMSWFASIAMAPAVDRLSRHMRRGVATLLVMLAFVIAAVIFIVSFGSLFVDQVAQIVASLPKLVEGAIEWVNQRFNQNIDIEQIKQALNLDADKAQALATQIGSQALSILGSVLGSVFGLFTFGLFTFYLSADGPRLRRWLAALFPERGQALFFNVWDITARKTGGYIGARVILAFINSFTTGIVFFFIGMPYWLALAIWTGVVAQFVPTIGTYIAIILPVIVGLLSPTPWIGVAALVWALVYQQVENLTIEPRISARAVDVHPAVAFGSVMLGAALFGVAGAFLAIPVVAMMFALLDIYAQRHEIVGDVSEDSGGGSLEPEPDPTPA
ncbi:MAG: AI-2E family transporter [Candidatus Nanopelagicales bacterium]